MTVEDLKYSLAAPPKEVTINSNILNELLHRYIKMRHAVVNLHSSDHRILGPHYPCGICELILEVNKELFPKKLY